MLSVENLGKHFGDKQVLKNISFRVNPGDIAMITGPSGVGKTTLIRCLTGLEHPNEGTITIKGESVQDANQIGLVFQNFNLFPHLTATENVSFALKRVKGMSQQEADALSNEMLEILGMRGHEDHYEFQLSGGQRQRVAIARALAMHPEFLCFDEPTSALDPNLRDSVGEILQTIAQKGTGVIVITHDYDFAKQYATKLYKLGSQLQQVNRNGDPIQE